MLIVRVAVLHVLLHVKRFVGALKLSQKQRLTANKLQTKNRRSMEFTSGRVQKTRA